MTMRQLRSEQRMAFSLVRGLIVGLGGLEPPTSSLSGTCAGMRSCWQRRRLPAHWWRGSDRGCPLGTVIDPPIWHAGGTVRPARLLASFRRGIPTWSRAARGYRRGMRAGAGTRDLGRGGREPAAAGRAGPYDPSRPYRGGIGLSVVSLLAALVFGWCSPKRCAEWLQAK
jgi:hypothetical protein